MPASRVKHHYTLVCEYALFDRDYRPSFLGVVRNVKLPQIPGAVVSLYFVASFSAPAGTKFAVDLIGPNRKVLARGEEREVTPQSPSAGTESEYVQTATTAMMEAKPAVFRTQGIHYVALRVDGKVIHREPFAVFEESS